METMLRHHDALRETKSRGELETTTRTSRDYGREHIRSGANAKVVPKVSLLPTSFPPIIEGETPCKRG